jgi:PEP-CTERM motif
MQRIHLTRLALTAALGMLTAGAQAAAIDVPYTGNYDERVSAPSGDYDAIGGLDDVGQFTLLAGNNFFLGGIKTPGDSSDVFLIRIAAGFNLVGASIEWGTNANDFNPIFASPAPIWTLEESDADPTIFLQNLGGNRATAPLIYNAPVFQRGEGLYSMLIGNGTFAMNNNDPIAYRMRFIVEALPTNAVPEPATLALVGLALAGVVATRRRAQK